ncbi:MAG TPA: hypothetical protein VFF05_09630 [Rudaea sp.]|jgi:hypothetical protein|nr:hypothetical protein [Rudaea sp.]
MKCRLLFCGLLLCATAAFAQAASTWTATGTGTGSGGGVADSTTDANCTLDAALADSSLAIAQSRTKHR